MRRLVLRTKGAPYIGMSILLLPFAIWLTVSAWNNWSWDAAKAILFLYGILIIWYVYLFSFKVVITGSMLSVRNFYIWHRIQIPEIEQAYIQTSMKTWLGERMTFRIWVQPRKGSGRKGFFIPIVNYKPEQLRQLYEILDIKSKRTSLFGRKKI